MLANGLTRAALIPQLKAVAGALNATRPADINFQVILGDFNCLDVLVLH
jgi:hypothetical protein